MALALALQVMALALALEYDMGKYSFTVGLVKWRNSFPNLLYKPPQKIGLKVQALGQWGAAFRL